MRARIAVLASGRGSNFRALLDYLDARGHARGGDVVLLATDRADAAARDVARDRGIDSVALPVGPGLCEALLRLLAEWRIDFVALTGFLRLVPSTVVRAYAGRVVNVHPALLPAFGGKGMYGERVHDAVLAAGVRLSGATVHFVDEAYDHGPVIAQWPVPVAVDDTPATLAARVLRVEHALFPRVIDAVAAGRVVLGADGRVRGTAFAAADSSFALVPHDDELLGRAMDIALGR